MKKNLIKYEFMENLGDTLFWTVPKIISIVYPQLYIVLVHIVIFYYIIL